MSYNGRGLPTARLPVQPLLDATGLRYWRVVQLHLKGRPWGGPMRYMNYQRDGLPVLIADRMAVNVARRHPGSIWPEWWQL